MSTTTDAETVETQQAEIEDFVGIDADSDEGDRHDSNGGSDTAGGDTRAANGDGADSGGEAERGGKSSSEANTPDIPPTDHMTPTSGVRALRDDLEWYRDAHGRGASGPEMAISGVWAVICGKPHKGITPGNEKTAELDAMEAQIAENREQFVANNDFDIETVDRVIGLLRGLQEVDHETRFYREDREREGRFDIRASCFVGLYHVTDKTTIITFRQTTPGMGFTAYTNRGVESPRKDVDEKIEGDILYDKYDYAKVHGGSDD
jgi:hypothetical protein